MALDKDSSKKEIKSRIRAYKTVSEVYQNNKLKDKIQRAGDSYDDAKSNVTQNLNDAKGWVNDQKTEAKNQYDDMIEFFNETYTDKQTKFNDKRSDIKEKIDESPFTDSVSFLLRQVLKAAQNAQSRIGQIVTDEIIKTAGCSEEQQFNGNTTGGNRTNKIYLRINQIDLFKILKHDPSENFNSLLYEKEDRNNGVFPYPMDKELYTRIQNEGNSFYDEFNQDYIGESGGQLMDFKYVTSYQEGGITYNGDFLEVTLTNRVTGNNLSDFLVDYYKSISILDFDSLSVKLMNSFNNIIDISLGLTTSEKEEQTRFDKIVQRILGLCFDSNREIDVSGNAKISVLDSIDDSFFEMSSIDLRNIENEVNDFSNGVIEYKDCGNIKLPVNVNGIAESLQNIRNIPDSQKVDKFMESIYDDITNDEENKKLYPDGINIDIAIKNGLLKIIPRAVATTVLSPKVLLGLVVALKSVGSIKIDFVEDLKTFSENMREFMIELISKISAVFVEELFKLLKKNIRKLVEILMLEIVRESKDSRLKAITSVVFILLQLANAALDWRECKSVVDEIINLLNLTLTLISDRIPSWVLASSGLLGGFSPTRAFADAVERAQKAGLESGPQADGSPNEWLSGVKDTIDSVHSEQVSNGKTEIFIPPLSVIALGGGTTLPGRGIGKTY